MLRALYDWTMSLASHRHALWVLAAVSFDETGTTRIGKYLLNHSFMIPGLVTTATATAVALLLGSILL